MSCNHCNSKFSFFTRESGCTNCGLSLCTKCLEQKCLVPGKGEGKVCRTCYPKLRTGSAETQFTEPPPDRFLRRLKNPQDEKLAQRLEQLKEKPSRVTDEEIRQRLAKLKGHSTLSAPTPTPSTRNDTRTEEEQVNALLEQLRSEPKMDRVESVTPRSSSVSPELPWCVLCNNDAKFRCTECSGDLYCAQCNTEVHREWGETDHNVVPYDGSNK